LLSEFWFKKFSNSYLLLW